MTRPLCIKCTLTAGHKARAGFASFLRTRQTTVFKIFTYRAGCSF
ncbi:hypothetical protein SLEP1_g35263 [Rubroshorea leprosula]|uniref:Uncharacterized protein n=1 Tax=Rubroshorea leprosula TaxID=152421 RepID=A0AAV5KMV4_9ROSI|nr:hypothetical protein SLEP1_g35263 [Rubroshorea leprosula]